MSEDQSEPSRPIIWTISVSRLSRLLHDVTPEFDARARIENIHLGFEQAVTTLRGRLRKEGCDVIIAAGSNGAYLKNRIDRPVVLVKPDGFDLMQALTTARRSSENIGLLTHAEEVPAFEAFQESFGLNIVQGSFVTAEDARSQVRELIARNCKVIVGTGMAADLAESAGIAGVLLYSANTIRQAFESALEIAGALGAARNSAEDEGGTNRTTPTCRYRITDLSGTSPAIASVKQQIELLAPSEQTVLIRGETGTGKELVAQAIHVISPRRAAPFVAVNCGAVADSLLESELFGYEDGAFTGARRGGKSGLIESANKGTLFLDEISEMPLLLQTRLLRVLEEREVLKVSGTKPVPVNIRVVAATHRDLSAMIAAGEFRQDLFYRLNILSLELPPLAARKDDIELLARQFLQEVAPACSWAPNALELLKQHSWPGNVRELRNLVQRVAVYAATQASPIDSNRLRDIAPELGHSVSAQAKPSSAASPRKIVAWPVERRRNRPDSVELSALLEKFAGDRRAVAASLGVSRTTLWRWMRELHDAYSEG